jgi:secreted trypsin-like serine protease
MRGRGTLGILATVVLAEVLTGFGPAPAQARPAAHPRPLRAAPNIVGGSDASGSSLGMVAYVIYNAASGSFLCSGTIVSPDVILTAGHCAENESTGVTDTAADYQVLTGTQSLSVPGQVSAVTTVIPYPTFNPATLSGDAAVLVLATPTTAAPVALASDPTDAYLYDGGTATVITGWGIDDSAEDLPNDLQYGYSIVQNASYCTQHVSNLPFSPLSQLCAIDTPSYADGTCNGDSGGPILASVSQTWVEIGLTSFGASNCSTAQPGFFTRTDSIYSWVESEIEAHPPATPAPPTAAPPAPVTPTAPTTPATPATHPLPEAGTYHGRTSQDRTIRATVNPSHTSISNLRFGFTLRCTQHPRLTFTDAPGLVWKLSLEDGLGFRARFRDRTETQYRLAGTFSSSGTALGTLSVTWRTSRYGKCTSGPVRWSASR